MAVAPEVPPVIVSSIMKAPTTFVQRKFVYGKNTASTASVKVSL